MTVDKGEVRINNHACKSKAAQMRRTSVTLLYTNVNAYQPKFLSVRGSVDNDF